MRFRLSRIPPIVPVLLLQLFALGIAALGARATGLLHSPLLIALLAGVLAAALSRVFGLERWWVLIQLLFAPAAVLLLALQLNRWVYLGTFIALLLVYWSTFRTRVPLYLSGPRVWRAVQDLLPEALPGTRLRVIDLGSGLAGLLISLAEARRDGEFFGVELAPLPAFISRLRIAWRRLPNCHISWGSYWPLDLARYDVVFAFLSPVPMGELWRKARSEMRAGSLFISSSFEVPGESAQQVISVDDARGTRLHVWTM
jgi:hypothetical protein